MEKQTKREIDPRAVTRLWKCELSDYGIEWRDKSTIENKRERERERERREGKSNGREKRKYQETKKCPIEKWKIEDASTKKKMTVKICRENSSMTYQRIQRENDVEETETWNTKRRGKRERQKGDKG